MDIKLLTIKKDLKYISKKDLLNEIYKDLEHGLPVFIGTVEQKAKLLEILEYYKNSNMDD